jgi:hypothetical protein
MRKENIYKFNRAIKSLARKNPILVGVFTYFMGALANKYTDSMLVVSVISLVLIVLLFVINRLGMKKIDKITEFEISIMKPDPHAKEFLKAGNDHKLIVGKVIEISSHPTLNSRAFIGDLGWDVAEISISSTPNDFNHSRFALKSGIVPANIKHDGDKFSLIEIGELNSDNPELKLKVSKTKFSIVQSAKEALMLDGSLRTRFGSLDPSASIVPHSLCLHFIMQFADGNLLMQKRSNLSYYGGCYSFSGEEQLSDKDFVKNNKPALSLFKRAFCEEVFPLVDNKLLDNNWTLARSAIKRMKIWSLFLEEEIMNFDLLGYYELALDVSDYRKKFIAIQNSARGSRDNEGSMYIISLDNIKKMISCGSCEITGLFSEKKEMISEEILHPTSRYRMFRYLRAANKGALKMSDFSI